MGLETVCCFCSESKPCKRRRVQFDVAEYSGEEVCLFDCLPDDIVLSILCCLSASAERPSDLVSVMKTCTRMNRLGNNPLVLEKATLESISIRVENWSPQAHEFMTRCAHAGNVEACYLLGMIEFYCMGIPRDRWHARKGLSYLLRASQRGHARATYSLAMIFFQLLEWARARKISAIDAIRGLRHWLTVTDGYGVAKEVQ